MVLSSIWRPKKHSDMIISNLWQFLAYFKICGCTNWMQSLISLKKIASRTFLQKSFNIMMLREGFFPFSLVLFGENCTCSSISTLRFNNAVLFSAVCTVTSFSEPLQNWNSETKVEHLVISSIIEIKIIINYDHFHHQSRLSLSGKAWAIWKCWTINSVIQIKVLFWMCY